MSTAVKVRDYKILIVILVLLGGSAGGTALAVWMLNRPTGMRPREVRVDPGMSARAIGDLLYDKGLIRDARIFEWLARAKKHAHKLEAGTYRLDGSNSTSALLEDLLRAPIQSQRVTIPEGLTRHETASRLSRQTALDSARFVALTEDRAFVSRLGIEAPTMEGYLFPETYFLDLDDTESDVIERMVAEFHVVFADSLRRRLSIIGMSLHQAVTLASIVEGEARIAEERPIISAVFQRRLDFNRRLESCATVEYALGVHKKRLTNADLQVDSPFNTYRHRGLPPAPIGSPGRASITAALFPADTEFLYFVARGDGGHIFSRTNKEHEKAKRALRLERRRSRLAN
jgi:UPF0755 protein